VSNDQTADLEADIEFQRDQLAETVDQLAYKLDVRARAKQRVERLRRSLTTDGVRPRPQPLAVAAAALAVVGGLIWWRRSAG